jgi:RimJ/RimL family protein N-acetyltransferase
MTDRIHSPTGAEPINTLSSQKAQTLVKALLRQGQVDQARQFLSQVRQVHPNDLGLNDLQFLLHPGWKRPVTCAVAQLRIPTTQDAPFFKNCFDNTRFMHDFHRSARRYSEVSEIEQVLSRQISAEVHKSASIHWVIESITASQTAMCGLASLVNISAAHRRAEFLMGVPSARSGLRSMALVGALLVMDFAFNRVGLNKLTSIVMADNTHSQKSTLEGVQSFV